MKSLQLALYTLLVGWSALTSRADVRLARVFTDHMVLQRDRPVPVWGSAPKGELVTVMFCGQSKVANVDAGGKWSVKLDPLPATEEGKALLVSCGDSSIRLEDVVVGDVWMLAGQSNMTWWLEGDTGGGEAIRRAEYPWLRWFDNQGSASDDPAEELPVESRWRPCTPGNAARFSAIGFYFAEALHAHSKIPIGLLMTATAGTYGECWLSRKVFEEDPEFRPSNEAYQIALQQYPLKYQEWTAQRAAWQEKADAAKSSGQPEPPLDDYLENGPMGPTHYRRPWAQYNGRVRPLQPFAIHGMIWYQGEGDTATHLVLHYQHLLTTLARTWRQDWGQGDFPFLIVQLPRYQNDDQNHSWPLLREAQLKASAELNNCGLVISIDTGERESIHPRDKFPIGTRLARLARVVADGEKIEATGPIFKEVLVADKNAVIKFNHVGAGLVCRQGDLQSFLICGPDKVFHPAQAKIASSDSVIVSSMDVQQPVAVRYGWSDYPDCNLFNSEGLPASPFRTDNF